MKIKKLAFCALACSLTFSNVFKSIAYCKDLKYDVILTVDYDTASNFSEGLALVSKDGKYGFIDESGEVVIPLQFDSMVYDFKEGLACVEIDGKFGFIDKTGNIVIPCQYEDGYPYNYDFKDGLAPVKKDGKWGYIDKEGNTVIPFIFYEAKHFDGGLAPVKNDIGRQIYIDRTGKKVIDKEFNHAAEFSEGVAEVCNSDVYDFIDTNGDYIKELNHVAVRLNFKDGLAPLSNGSGYIDKKGNLAVRYTSVQAWEFNNGVALVNTLKAGPYNYIDTDGNVISKEFGYATSFNEDGIAAIMENEKYQYIKINNDAIFLDVKADVFPDDREIKFDLSDTKLSNNDILNLMGVSVDENGEIISYIGGKYDYNTKIFTSIADNTDGNFRLIIGNDKIYKNAILKVSKNEILANGKMVTLDTKPIIENGKTYVPVRAISESLGADVSYDESTKTAIIELDDEVIEFQNGVNNDTSTESPIIVNGRMLVPLRYVSESLHAKVIWYPKDKSIQIIK